MKPSFLFFCVVAILAFVAGFYFHEGLNEKVQYERDTCYEVMNKHLSTTNPEIVYDLDINDTGDLYGRE